MTDTAARSFADLGLEPSIVEVLLGLGYETPTPIQSQSIPVLLQGSNLLGQAQTGTGKTAAFALPLISKIDLTLRAPQVLVLTPTRELAIQVAEAFQTYSRSRVGFHVLPIYGGQSMQNQLRQLKRGPHVIVGTPGRIIDHLKRKSLSLATIKALVLDEADEMLKMGFIEDIEWILEHSPEEKQTALFSATMPAPIRRVAAKYLKNSKEVKIHSKTSTVETIRQLYWMVSGLHKLDALTRILEIEPVEAALIFVRTKTATVELAEKLEARGYGCAALNGDLNQALRERTIERVKSGDLDIIVATDVAARGLDVERISHVINYDIPYDTESYIHRIGRTGRAGREGCAILFVSMREQRLLRTIEKATRQKMELLKLPSKEDVYQHRVQRFSDKLMQVLEQEDLSLYTRIVEQFVSEKNCDQTALAAALCFLAQKDAPFLPRESPEQRVSENSRPARGSERKDRESRRPMDFNMVTYRIAVGRKHGVTPANIVGTITRTAGLTGDQIGYIKLHDDFSTVDLPEGMPRDVFKTLKRTEINRCPLEIEVADDPSGRDGSERAKNLRPNDTRLERPSKSNKKFGDAKRQRKDFKTKDHSPGSNRRERREKKRANE